jgi:putative membrane protein
MAMGIAEVIPGVSGGTIAFISGIYERLLNAIRAINPKLIKTFKQDGLKEVLKQIDALFLLKLFAGMAIGFLLGLKVITHMLENYPIIIWSFFFGLILASIPMVAKQISRWTFKEYLLILIGTIFVYWITIAAPSQGSDHLLFVFIAGVISVSALMLPGLSGSFVLLLMGMYTIIMPSISSFISSPNGQDGILIGVFGLGLIVGVFSFARVLSWMFSNYKNQTLAVLTGFLIGSLNKVWPWQHVLETRISSRGHEQVLFSESILPNTFRNLGDNFLYGNDPKILGAIVSIVVAVGIIYLLDRYASTSQ